MKSCESFKFKLRACSAASDSHRDTISRYGKTSVVIWNHLRRRRRRPPSALSRCTRVSGAKRKRGRNLSNIDRRKSRGIAGLMAFAKSNLALPTNSADLSINISERFELSTVYAYFSGFSDFAISIERFTISMIFLWKYSFIWTMILFRWTRSRFENLAKAPCKDNVRSNALVKHKKARRKRGRRTWRKFASPRGEHEATRKTKSAVGV